MKKNKDRRTFLKKTLLGVGGFVFAHNIISCSTEFNEFSALTSFLKFDSSSFQYGVASFDPTDSQFIIWTRYTSSLKTVNLEWQLSTNPEFTTIQRYGQVKTDVSRDYTISIEVQDLLENTIYYYRFIELISRNVSVIGETRTFSETHVSELKLGSISCANYELGYFNVYKEMAISDIDIVVHLGDYIYEHSSNGFGTNENTIALHRSHEPVNELTSLEDYRTRYKQYRSDNDLQLLHQKKPFICIWDDHEIANDAYKNGASAHQEEEGDFELRKQIALQAYHEYLPFKTNDERVVYRSFKFGNLVQLTMLDTRLAGRVKQLNYANYANFDGTINEVSFRNDWLDRSRTILGTSQKNWFFNEVNNCSAEWLIVGQQVLMGKMYYPVELVSELNTLTLEKNTTGNVSEQSLLVLQNQLFELVQIKVRLKALDPTLNDSDKQRITNVLPFNLDSWDGYPLEREEILRVLKNKNTIVFAGDSHNAWHNKMFTTNGVKEVNEFATASVTSPGFEYLLEDAAQRENFKTAIIALVDELVYFNCTDRGYIKLSVKSGQATSEWTMVDSILNTEYTVKVDQSTTI
jgi:alkaline phosphatase D